MVSHLAPKAREGESIVFIVLMNFFKFLSQCERITVMVSESNGYGVRE
jgi:hypothetical protein